jgi:hypothetical protein
MYYPEDPYTEWLSRHPEFNPDLRNDPDSEYYDPPDFMSMWGVFFTIGLIIAFIYLGACCVSSL